MLIRAAHLADAEQIAHVRVDSWRTTYQNILPGDYLENLSYEQNQRNWQSILSANGQQGTTLVVEDDKQVVGFIVGGFNRDLDEHFRSEIYALYLLQAYQRRGLGRALVKAFVQEMLALGFESMLVWVLADNPARKFYERLGGKLVYQKDFTIGHQAYVELAYGWEAIQSMLDSPPETPLA